MTELMWGANVGTLLGKIVLPYIVFINLEKANAYSNTNKPISA